MRGTAGFSPQESSPHNGGINLPQTTGSGESNETALPTSEQRREIVDLLGSQPNEATPPSTPGAIKVGTVLPQDAPLRTIPEKIGQLYAPWRNYNYVKAGNEYLIVSPGRRVAAIIVAE
jgi:hypothetical protein